MMFDEMEFASWETNGGEATGPTLRVELDGRSFLIQLANDFLRFCEVSSRTLSTPREWNFAVREPVRVSKNTIVNAEFLRVLFMDEWQRGHIGRVIFLDDGALFLGRNGVGSVFSRKDGGSYGQHAREIPFEFAFEGDFDSICATEWRHHVADWDADETSDLSFARKLAGEEGNDLTRLLCSFGGAGWSEMERVARLILQLDTNWNNSKYDYFPVVGVRVRLRRASQPQLELVCAEDEWDIMEDYHYDRAQHRPGALWEIWLADFVRGFDEDKLSRHIGGDAIRECKIVITNQRREQSAHEQLETRLQLRDWLREHAQLSDERISELLR